jgi:hypothetical protein
MVGPLFAVGTGIQALGTVAGGFLESESIRRQAEAKRLDYAQNMMLAKLQEQDARRRGQRLAGIKGGQVAQAVGAVRAGFAAQGVSVSTGTAAAIAAQTLTFGMEDVMQIQNNAWREVFGYKMERDAYRIKTKYARLAESQAQRATLITSGLQLTRDLMGAAKFYSGMGKTGTAPTSSAFRMSTSGVGMGIDPYGPGLGVGLPYGSRGVGFGFGPGG